jgi:hypothetical protein
MPSKEMAPIMPMAARREGDAGEFFNTALSTHNLHII